MSKAAMIRAERKREALLWLDIAAAFGNAAPDGDGTMRTRLANDGLCSEINDLVADPSMKKRMHRRKAKHWSGLFEMTEDDEEESAYWYSRTTQRGRLERMEMALKCARECLKLAGE